MKRKLMALMLAGSMALSLFGCGQDDGKGSESKSEQSAASENHTGGQEEDDGGEFSYPMEPITLTLNRNNVYQWGTYVDMFNPDLTYANFNQLREKTGVTLEPFGCESADVNSPEFTLMLVNADKAGLPDIVECNWNKYNGGPAAAIRDGYIIALNDYIDKWMPNFKKILDENPQVKNMISLPDGTITMLPHLCLDEGDFKTSGFAIRKDWVESQGFKVSTTMTIAELDQVLRAVKDAYELEGNGKAPLTFELRWLWNMNSACLSSAYHTMYGFHAEDGKVSLGPLDPSYKDFVAQMQIWYRDGILDPDIATVGKSEVRGKFALGRAAMALCTSVDPARQQGADVFYVDGTVSEEEKANGAIPQYGAYPDGIGYGWSISTSCKDIEAACRFLDYGFSEEGSMLLSYGVEGVTYNIDENGKVIFTDLILNAEGGDPTSCRDFYTRWAGWAMYIRGNYYLSTFTNPNYEEDLADTNMKEHSVSDNLPLTEEEAAVIGEYWNDLDTHCREMIMLFITGEKDMSEWDDFVQGLHDNWHIDEVIAAKQSAYDRVMKDQ